MWGLVLQFIFGLLILRWSVGAAVFQCIGDKVGVVKIKSVYGAISITLEIHNNERSLDVTILVLCSLAQRVNIEITARSSVLLVSMSVRISSKLAFTLNDRRLCLCHILDVGRRV